MCGERRARTGESVGCWTFGPLTVEVTMPARTCDACGETTIAGDDLARAEHAVTRAVVLSGSTHPDALRWLRKGAGSRMVDIAAHLADRGEEPAITAAQAGLTPEQEEGIRLAMAQVERGETVPWETVRAELKARLSARLNDP